jgi:hypothetical protein
MERGDRWASSSVSSAKGSVARETSAMGVKRQGPWPEGWDPAAYIGGPEGLSRTRGLGVGGGPWGADDTSCRMVGGKEQGRGANAGHSRIMGGPQSSLGGETEGGKERDNGDSGRTHRRDRWGLSPDG